MYEKFCDILLLYLFCKKTTMKKAFKKDSLFRNLPTTNVIKYLFFFKVIRKNICIFYLTFSIGYYFSFELKSNQNQLKCSLQIKCFIQNFFL